MLNGLLKIFFKFHNEMRVFGSPPDTDRTLIFVANHTSALDPVVLAASLPYPVRSLGKKELFKGPIGFFLRVLGALPVDRENKAGAASAYRACLRVLKNGQDLILFPEGHRSEDGRLKELTRGFAALSAHSGSPVVPVYISGAFESMPPGSKSIDLYPISVIFGKPVYPHKNAENLIFQEVESELHRLEDEVRG